VAYAEPNYLVSTQDIVPNDPSWNVQYGPTNIQAPQAWEVTTGAASVAIAVIDTGVDLAHPELDDKIWTNPGETGADGDGNDRQTNGIDDDLNGFIDDWRGWDFVNLDNEPQDDYGHGTHVAGIAAAETDNSQGIAGVSWGARIVPVKVLGSGGFGSYADVAAGMIYAADIGAQVINLSLGGGSPSELLEDAADYAVANGSVVVAAAGNSPGLPVLYPAAYPSAIAVSSVDQANQLSSFSSYGPEVDLAAPGTLIYSTMWTNGQSTYATLNGTSMATPHVAGVAALLAGLPQFQTPAAIRTALELTALDLGPAGADYLYGSGLVQAYAALQLNPAVITPSPTPTATYTQMAPVPQTLSISLSCPVGVEFDWVTAAGGVNTSLHQDDFFAPVNLPFQFVFDGFTFTAVKVSTNGYLTFDNDATRWVNSPLPSPSTPNLFIAPYWDDLNPRAGGNIYYATLGSAPNRKFVVKRNNVPRYSFSGPNNGEGAVTFQAILHETTNEITFQYLNLDGIEATGGSATVGIEFSGGLSALLYSYNVKDSLHEGMAIHFAARDGPPPTPGPYCYHFPIMQR
jgi:hypothetical protein